jgi:hypothetical protein
MSEAKATARPWGWQKFGDQWCLVGQHGMRPIVLAVRKGKLTSLVNGLLVPFDPEHPDAALIVDAPNAHDSLLARNKRLAEAILAARRLNNLGYLQAEADFRDRDKAGDRYAQKIVEIQEQIEAALAANKE